MHTVTQTVQIRGIIITSAATAAAYTAVVAYDRFAPYKNLQKKEIKNVSKLSICKQSIKLLQGHVPINFFYQNTFSRR